MKLLVQGGQLTPGRENLRYFAVLYKLEPGKARSRVEELLELEGLRDRRYVYLLQYG